MLQKRRPASRNSTRDGEGHVIIFNFSGDAVVEEPKSILSPLSQESLAQNAARSSTRSSPGIYHQAQLSANARHRADIACCLSIKDWRVRAQWRVLFALAVIASPRNCSVVAVRLLKALRKARICFDFIITYPLQVLLSHLSTPKPR